MQNPQADELIHRAMQFACDRHAGQVDPYTGAPRTHHLAAVAGLVSVAEASNASLVAAAWLHDILEAAATPLSELEAEFGTEVARLVKGVTPPSSWPGRAGARCMPQDRSYLARGCAHVHTIKLAQIVSRCASLSGEPSSSNHAYLAEQRTLLALLVRGDLRLHALAELTLREATRPFEHADTPTVASVGLRWSAGESKSRH